MIKQIFIIFSVIFIVSAHENWLIQSLGNIEYVNFINETNIFAATKNGNFAILNSQNGEILYRNLNNTFGNIRKILQQNHSILCVIYNTRLIDFL